MEIELKNIRVYEGMSEETQCYQASLYVDGKKIGDVSNRGHGGCDEFHGDWDKRNAADRWLKENKPRVPFGAGMDGDFAHDLEWECNQQVTDFLINRDMKRALKRKCLFRKADGKIYEIPFKKWAKETVYQHVRAKHPDAMILNLMDEVCAFEAYRDAA